MQMSTHMPNAIGSGKENKGIVEDDIYISRVSGTGHVTMAGKRKGHFRTRATLERQAVERTSDLQSLLATASNLSMNIYKHLQAQILETLPADAVPHCASTVKSIEMPALTVHPQWNAAAKISSISRFKNFTGFHCSDLSNLQQDWLSTASLLCSLAASVTRFHCFISAQALAANCGLPVLSKICCPRHGQDEELLQSQIKVAIGKVP